jgi:hypothetical protein
MGVVPRERAAPSGTVSGPPTVRFLMADVQVVPTENGPYDGAP